MIVPLHPRTRRTLSFLPLTPYPSNPNLRLIGPVSYLDMLVLEKNARVILTDSGGVQKEAFFFQVPCVTLREETEWVETVEAGWNVLVGCDPDRIHQTALDLAYRSPAPSPPCTTTPLPPAPYPQPYGDGHAAERIVALVVEQDNVSRRRRK